MLDKNNLPKRIYATEIEGTNGIHCLDYRNFDDDVEYIRIDILDAEHRCRIAAEAVIVAYNNYTDNKCKWAQVIKKRTEHQQSIIDYDKAVKEAEK